VLHFPPDDSVPDFLRGMSYTVVMGAFLGDEEHGRAFLSPFLDLGPVIDTFAMQRPIALAQLAMDPEAPLPFRSATALLDELTPEAIRRIGELAVRGSALSMIQLRHGGGALSRTPDGAGARATLPGQIVVFGLGVVPEPSLEPVIVDQLAQLGAAVDGARLGSYVNFVEEPADASTFFDPDTWARLCAVKAAYDPDDVIRANHPIPPQSTW
jgi:hypothetical protein